MEEIESDTSKMRVCAGIVTYNPDLDTLVRNVSSICNQVELVIISDNGSADIDSIRKLSENYENVILIENYENVGIAKALNIIFARAKNHFDWVLTLDQDSVCDHNMINSLLDYASYPDIGIICPGINYQGNEKSGKKNQNEIDYVEACMTSGSLTLVDAWVKSNGFDEWMFIDYVDNDFGMRLKLNGYKILRANRVKMSHMLGKTKTISFGFFKVAVYNHNSWRNYYYTRNSVFFIRKYRKALNVPKYIAILLFWEFKKIAFEKYRLKTISSMMRGLKDGFRAKI